MRWSLIASCFFLACAAPPESTGAPGAAPAATPMTPIEVPPPPEAPEISEARAAFYATVFANAQRFVARPIPRDMLLSADKGNDTYVRALDTRGELLGYLRDFSGPVIAGRRTNPDPIAVLLAFAPDLSLITIAPSEPLKNGESTTLTNAEVQQLIGFAKKPPAALTGFPRTSDVVDATTEATRPALAASVVSGAAYTTHRIVGLVASSRDLIQKAPATWDRKRVQQVAAAPASNPSLAHALAELLPTLETVTARTTVYQMMSHTYAVGLAAGGQPDTSVEALLLNPPLADTVANTEIAQGCYGLARANLRSALVGQCVARVSGPSSHPGDPASVARLAGTHHYLRGDLEAALPPLSVATKTYDHLRDPALHLRLVLSAIAAGKPKTVCATAKKLFRDHPLLPEVKKALQACRPGSGDVAGLMETIRKKQKATLLAGRREGNEPAPTLSLEGDNFQTVEVNPVAANTITVLVFFSTWCPHCAAELPLINGFVKAARALPHLRDRVRVIGIRTAVEKERIPYEQFIADLKPEFPIYTDATFSLVFGQFIRTQELRPELPTVAVLDSQGVVRFLIPSGEYRDTGQELVWAVEALEP